jgi:2-C-methyl-D-erythritol 4-phosphate cytidylyltransferase/2-C-methyl-D-erythritol 2,4-cyclodiphosphate synthase
MTQSSTNSRASNNPSPAAPTCLGRLFGLVPAAGVGSRFGSTQPKQYAQMTDGTVIENSVRALLSHPNVVKVFVVVQSTDTQAASLFAGQSKVVVLTCGGGTRAETVRNGLHAIHAHHEVLDQDWVLVHDAARPGLAPSDLNTLVEQAQYHPVGGILAMQIADTLKRADACGQIIETVERDGLWAAQTPQMFRHKALSAALDAALAAGVHITDEASAIEHCGFKPMLVKSSPRNWKITLPQDIELVESLMNNSPRATSNRPQALPQIRIGQGYDVHKLVEGRPLMLGGVVIPHSKGLLGHSDADALLHAITDALLGASGLGDIGQHFADTDPQFKDADSAKLLNKIVNKIWAAGWRIVNVDATVIAQQPKLAQHIPAMKERIASLLDIPNIAVNIKAKTNEQLGYLGREEAIESQAVILLAAM